MGLEVVVRPVIFPNIRPAPVAQPVNAPDDPSSGQCVITGSSGKSIDLPYSWSVSSSTSKPVETKRRVDLARVYQVEDDGSVNKDNFVDIHVANKIWYRGGASPGRRQFAEVDPNYPTFQQLAQQGVPVSDKEVKAYRKAQEAKNIEIRERNKILKNPDAGLDYYDIPEAGPSPGAG